jgi:hypothetical protein
MIRTTKKQNSKPREAPRSDQSRYEPEPGWRPLLEHLLAEAIQRYGKPLDGVYEVDNTDGWFYKAGLQKKLAISNSEAFNLIGLMCTSGDEDEIVCGRFPTEKYDEIAKFWQKAAQDFYDAVITGDIRVWARTGGIAGPFRPIAVDTWKKASSNIIDVCGSYGPLNHAGWLASCIYWDKLLGVSTPELCSFFSVRIQERRERTTKPEIIAIIKEAEKEAGKVRLDVRALKKICAEKCSHVSQETFLEVEAELRGPRERGRPSKQKK